MSVGIEAAGAADPIALCKPALPGESAGRAEAESEGLMGTNQGIIAAYCAFRADLNSDSDKTRTRIPISPEHGFRGTRTSSVIH